MATVPGVLYISSYMGQGGLPALQSLQPIGNQAQYFNDRDLFRYVPGNVDGTEGVGFKPWYDGTAGTGYEIDEGASTTTTVRVTPSPGWTVNEFAGRTATLFNLFGVSTNPLQLQLQLPITGNTADTLNFASGVPSTLTANGFVRVGTGRFVTYHPIAGAVGPLASHGSSWQAGGQGVGPDARMVSRIYDRIYPTSPQFYFVKFCLPDTLAVGWQVGGAARTAFLSELQRVSAAAALEGNVIRWEVVIIDNYDSDLAVAAGDPLTYVLNYQTNQTNLINWLRSGAVLLNTAAPYLFVNNPSLNVILANHHPDLWGVAAPLAAVAMRNANFAIATSLQRVALVDHASSSFAQDAVAPPTAIANYNAERKYYSFQSMLEFGEKCVDVFERQLEGLPTGGATSTGFPLYLLIGDSIGVGQIPQDWMANAASLSLIGPGPGTVKPEGQYIFNKLSNSFERYNPNTNSNTSGTVNDKAGPEASIIAELAKQHASFGLAKHCSNGSSLVNTIAAFTGGGTSGGRWAKTAGEHYPLALDVVTACKSYINGTYSKQADFRGVIVSLGHNDATSGAAGAAFAAALSTFVTNLRQDLSTRTSGKDFPIIFRLPQATALGANASGIGNVRAALLALAKVDGQVRVVEVDDLERDRVDDLHETPESSIISGRRCSSALVSASI